MPVTINDEWKHDKEEGKPTAKVTQTITSRWTAAEVISQLQALEVKINEGKQAEEMKKNWEPLRAWARDILGMDSNPELKQQTPKDFPEVANPMKAKDKDEEITKELQEASEKAKKG